MKITLLLGFFLLLVGGVFIVQVCNDEETEKVDTNLLPNSSRDEEINPAGIQSFINRVGSREPDNVFFRVRDQEGKAIAGAQIVVGEMEGMILPSRDCREWAARNSFGFSVTSDLGIAQMVVQGVKPGKTMVLVKKKGYSLNYYPLQFHSEESVTDVVLFPEFIASSEVYFMKGGKAAPGFLLFLRGAFLKEKEIDKLRSSKSPAGYLLRSRRKGGLIPFGRSGKDGRVLFAGLRKGVKYACDVDLKGTPFVPFEFPRDGIFSESPSFRVGLVSPMAVVCRPSNDTVKQGYVIWIKDGRPDLDYWNTWSRDPFMIRLCNEKTIEIRKRFHDSLVCIKVPKEPEKWFGRSFNVDVRSFGSRLGWQRYSSFFIELSRIKEPDRVSLPSLNKKVKYTDLEIKCTAKGNRALSFQIPLTLMVFSGEAAIPILSNVKYSLPPGSYEVKGSSHFPDRWLESSSFTLRGQSSEEITLRVKPDISELRVSVQSSVGGSIPSWLVQYWFFGNRKDRSHGIFFHYPGDVKNHLSLYWPRGTSFELRAIAQGYKPLTRRFDEWKYDELVGHTIQLKLTPDVIH